MDTLELSQDILELLANVASGLGNGRSEFRADADVRALSAPKVATKRKNAANAKRRNAYKWRMVGERFAFDCGYSADETERIDEWRDIIRTMANSRHIRDIARALFAPAKFARNAIANAPQWIRESTDEIRAEYVAGLRQATLADWRGQIQRYVALRDQAESVGAFPISASDMRAGNGSAFAGYVRKHWALAGYRTDIHGFDSEDAFQNGMVSALDAGHYVSPKRSNGSATGSHVPTYGHLWRHMRLAVMRASWQNAITVHHSDEFAPFDWQEWSTQPLDNPTIAEWAEFHEDRAVREAAEFTRNLIASERAERLAILTATRADVARLLTLGVSLATIARKLGRTVEGIERDLTADAAPAMQWLPKRKSTDTESAERMESAQRIAGHAHNLRIKFADIQADNYANGRVFTPAIRPESPVIVPTLKGASGNYDSRSESLRLRWIAMRNAGLGVCAL